LATVPALRRAARGWLNRIDLDAETAEDVVMATGEAVTNAVEHAYPHDAHGTVRLVMTETPGFGGGIEVQVGDDGRWQEPPTDPGFRGRGLDMVHALADQASVTTTPKGTTVAMCWNRR
jgi:anti-sigma regulatory factor (Ser/Thr protein kinase)